MSVVAIVGSDLLMATRIADAATAAGHQVLRVDTPDELPEAAGISVAFVDWGQRAPGWGPSLRAWVDSMPPPRLVVFGPHTDIAAHVAARDAGIGPMLARSKLVAGLPHLVG